MKICPICKARCFEDMEVCYGCMHRFVSDEHQDEGLQLGSGILAPTPSIASPIAIDEGRVSVDGDDMGTQIKGSVHVLDRSVHECNPVIEDVPTEEVRSLDPVNVPHLEYRLLISLQAVTPEVALDVRSSLTPIGGR